jgi:outer membrane protein W
MNKFLFKIFVVIQTVLITSESFAQILTEQNSSSLKKSKWIIGTGLNGVNDNAKLGSKYFDLKNSWNSSIQTINIDRKIFGDVYINAMFSKNLYKAGSRKDFLITPYPINFTSYDLNLKYTFERYLIKYNWLEPYVYVGYGYTNRVIENDKNNQKTDNFNTNLGLGAYVWLDAHWGFNLQASGKWSNTKEQTNYKHNIIGVVYRVSNK